MSPLLLGQRPCLVFHACARCRASRVQAGFKGALGRFSSRTKTSLNSRSVLQASSKAAPSVSSAASLTYLYEDKHSRVLTALDDVCWRARARLETLVMQGCEDVRTDLDNKLTWSQSSGCQTSALRDCGGGVVPHTA